MHKALIGLTAATALVAGSVSMPQTASAFPAWVVPAIVGAGAIGVVVGATAAQAQPTYVERRADATYYGDATVYAQPTYSAPVHGGAVYAQPGVMQGCTLSRQRVGGHWRTVQLCPYPY